MNEKNPNEEGPPYFSKETEDDYVDSPDTFVLRAERELQLGNMENAIEYLEKAIEEAKTYIDPKTPEKYKTLLEELKAGKRTSLMGDPQNHGYMLQFLPYMIIWMIKNKKGRNLLVYPLLYFYIESMKRFNMEIQKGQ